MPETSPLATLLGTLKDLRDLSSPSPTTSATAPSTATASAAAASLCRAAFLVGRSIRVATVVETLVELLNATERSVAVIAVPNLLSLKRVSGIYGSPGSLRVIRHRRILRRAHILTPLGSERALSKP
jgi:hypothetical protein